jgi:molecular chaperone GrpE
MTQKGLLTTLKKHGVELYDPKNQKFDPNKHEAVFDYEDESLVNNFFLKDNNKFYMELI